MTVYCNVLKIIILFYLKNVHKHNNKTDRTLLNIITGYHYTPQPKHNFLQEISEEVCLTHHQQHVENTLEYRTFSI